MGIVTRSLIAVPLKSKGAMWGIVQAVDRTADRFDWHHLEILESLTNWASIAIENANLFQSSRERLRRLQEAHARLALSEKMAALGRLAASLAHEINNPLQSIGMCLALIEESIGEREDAGDLRMDLGVAKSEVQRLSTLMQQLRDYYRPESASRQSTDVGQLLRNVLHLSSYQLNNANISVELGGDEDLPLIELNPNQLYQVLLNLVINAIDAMPDGGTLKINTVWQKGTGDLPPIIEIRIQDTGVGISAEDLPRIFEPFFSTKKSGTGLGLSISYEIINSFGGNIAVSSSPGSGTIFTVSLPVLSSS
jgi:signal transduction histidine kinase